MILKRTLRFEVTYKYSFVDSKSFTIFWYVLVCGI